MSAASARIVRRFLLEVLERTPTPARICLWHEVSHSDQQKLCDEAISPDGLRLEVLAESLTDKLYGAAAEHTETFGGPGQRFRLVAEDSRASQLAARGFRVPGTAQLGDTALSARAPDVNPAIVIQLMRHVENREENFCKLAQATYGQIQEENERLNRKIDYFERQRDEVFQIRENLLSDQANRDVMLVREHGEQRRRDEAVTKLATKVLPEIFAHLVRKKLLPANVVRTIATELTGGEGSTPATPAAPAPVATSAEPTSPPAPPAPTAPLARTVPSGEVRDAQGKLRDILRCVDRRAIVTSLKPEHQKMLDDLSGTGEDPPTMEEFRDLMTIFWAEMPDEIAQQMKDDLTQKHPEKLGDLLELAGFGGQS